MAAKFEIATVAVIAFLACQVPASRPAHAEIVVKERTKYYQISGRTGIELGRAMLAGASGPINKRHAIAATEASYGIGDAEIVARNGRCVVEEVTVTLELTYHLPKWRGANRASARLRRNWTGFFSELTRHEYQHGQIAREGARELEKTLMSMSGTIAFNCNDFGAFSTIRLNLLANRIKQRQLAFDRRENLRTSRISRLQATLLRAE